MIITFHFAFHSFGTWYHIPQDMILINKLWLRFILMFGKVGVDIFVIISGYFLINSKSIKVNKIIKLLTQILFYSFSILGIYMLLIHFKIVPYNNKQILKNIFPITYSEWWFASTYFVLYLISPYINKLLVNLDKEEYKNMLILSIIMWSIIPTISMSQFEGNNLIFFTFLYALGGYIRLHCKNYKFKKLKRKLIFAVLIEFSLAMLIEITGLHVYLDYIYNLNSLFIVIIAITLFVIFKDLDIKYNKWINIIASTTFGVYLIHDSHVLKPFIWKTLFRNMNYKNSIYLIPYSILQVAIIFTACFLIEYARQHIFKKIKLEEKIEKLIKIR